MCSERALCPTCGQPMPAEPKRYATPEARRARHAAMMREGALDRALWDQRSVLDAASINGERLPVEFRAADVGHHLRRVNRRWSDGQGVIGRALRFGTIVVARWEGEPGERRTRVFKRTAVDLAAG